MTLSILINHRAPIGRTYMTKPEHTRPFNTEHAKAGAPYCCSNGEEATILKWDSRNSQYPLIGIYGTIDVVETWTADGCVSPGLNGSTDLVMLPLGYCEGKPVFVGDKLIDKDHGHHVTALATWHQMNGNLWTWPKPEPVYPETTCPVDTLAIAYNAQDGFSRSLRAVANLAIRRAIEDGQVMLPEGCHICAGIVSLVPASMLEKVAKAVAETAFDHPSVLSAERLAAIIADVKAGRV